MRLVPLTLEAANGFILANHRHHGRVQGHKFSIGLASESGELVGCVVVGRPVSRNRDDGFTAEVTRLCTDGTKNACSMLYAAAWRAARAMGYVRLGTYILHTEDGTSLKAAGWRLVYQTSGKSWHRESRPRTDKAPTCPKQLWEASA